MSSKREIHARDFIQDLRAGMSDEELQEKYKLTTKGLQSTFRKLVLARALSEEEIARSREDGPEPAIVGDMRALPRIPVPFRLPIHDVKHPDIKGVVKEIYAAQDREPAGSVRNISEKGISVVGVATEPGETKTFLILGDDSGEVDPFMFTAECRWSEELFDSGDPVAGFLIVDIADEGLAEMKKLIRVLEAGVSL